MENKLFLIHNYEKVSNGNCSDFLDPKDTNYVISMLNKNHIKYKIWKMFPTSDKNIIYVDDINIHIFKIITKDELSHREILGTLFSHQIDNHKMGDIVFYNDWYFAIADSMYSYITTHMNEIGNKKIKLEEVDINSLEDFDYEYDEININVTSMRVDNIVSSITHKSRSQVEEMLECEYILLNYDVVKKKMKNVSTGDILSIRKYGKYKIGDIVNKKNKIYVSILKYK